MQNVVKRVSAVLLALLMLVSFMPSLGVAEEAHADTSVPEAAWNFDAETGELKGFADGSSYDNPTDLVIPAKIGDVPVKSIGRQAFYYTTYSGNKLKNPLTSLTLPEGIESIGYQAFQTSARTNKATKITIPASVKTLDYRAFYGWDSVKEVEFADGSKLESIGEAAFNSCCAIERVNLPQGLKTIGVDAFRDTSLSAVEIPNTVETIGATAFALTLIREFNVPASVSSWNKKTNGSDSTGTGVMFFRTATGKNVDDRGYYSQGTLEFTRVYDSTGLVTPSNSGAVVNPQPVTIKYVDSSGNSIQESEEAVGAEYNTVDETQGTYSTQYSLNEGGGDKHLYYDYTNPFTGTTYTYSNSQGGKDWAAALIGGNYFAKGNEYEFVAPKIAGYSTPDSQTKTITADDHEVTFVYEELPKVKLTTEGDGVTTDPAAGDVSDESEVTVTIHEPDDKKIDKLTVNDVDVTDELISDGVDYTYTFTMDGDTHVKATYKEISSSLAFNIGSSKASVGDALEITNLSYRGNDVSLPSSAIDIKEESGKKFALDTDSMTIIPQQSGTYKLSAYLINHPDTFVTREVEVKPLTVKLSVNNKGVLAKDNDGKAMAWREVEVDDIGDAEACTVDAVMVKAHKLYNSEDGWDNGGGFATKLWGVSSTNILFFVNDNGLPNGVTVDTVKDGDRVYASVNKDDETYGDFVTKFDKNEAEGKKGENIELTLTGHSGMAYTPEGKEYKPLEGIQVGIIKDGEFQGIKEAVTGEDGKVQISFDTPGEYVVTAQGDAKGIAQDWNLADVNMNFSAPYTPPIGKWDYSTFEFSVAYTDKNYGNGPYPADEIKYIGYMEEAPAESENDYAWEDLYYLKDTQVIKNFPIMAPACNVVVRDVPKEDLDKAVKAAEDALGAAEEAAKKADEAAKAAEEAAKKADESKKAAEEAAKTPGEAAVAAAEKAKNDADASEKAASDAAAKAEAAKKAADEAKAAADKAANAAVTDSEKEQTKQLQDKANEAVKKANDKKNSADKAAETAKAAKAGAEEALKKAKAEAEAKNVKIVTVNSKKVSAKAVAKAIAKAGGSPQTITKIILGKKVKKISKKAFAKYKNVKTLEVKTKKLKKKAVKGSLKGSKITKVQVKVGSKKVNKKFVKKYKKIFTKKVCGKKVKVK